MQRAGQKRVERWADSANDNYLRRSAGNDETADEDIFTCSYLETRRNVNYPGGSAPEKKLEGGSALPVCGEELDASKKCAPGEFRLQWVDGRSGDGVDPVKA